jgi:hypothetical protein
MNNSFHRRGLNRLINSQYLKEVDEQFCGNRMRDDSGGRAASWISAGQKEISRAPLRLLAGRDNRSNCQSFFGTKAKTQGLKIQTMDR